MNTDSETIVTACRALSCAALCFVRRDTLCAITMDSLLAKNKLWIKITGWLAVLQTLGGWGVLTLTAIDSGAIPIPVDVLVAGYVLANPGRAWLYVIAGTVGSVIGSLVPYYLGFAGGELFLLKRI